MRITIENYQSFIEALEQEMSDLNRQMKVLESGFGDDPDPSEYYEYNELWRCENYLKKTHDYFFDAEDRLAEFESLDALKAYVGVLRNLYEAMTAYSDAMLPSEDCDDLVGVTYEEWDKSEGERYKVGKRLSAWTAFAEFCEFGRV